VKIKNSDVHPLDPSRDSSRGKMRNEMLCEMLVVLLLAGVGAVAGYNSGALGTPRLRSLGGLQATRGGGAGLAAPPTDIFIFGLGYTGLAVARCTNTHTPVRWRRTSADRLRWREACQGGPGRVGRGLPNRGHLPHAAQGACLRRACLCAQCTCTSTCSACLHVTASTKQADALKRAGIEAFFFDIDGAYEPMSGHALETLHRRYRCRGTPSPRLARWKQLQVGRLILCDRQLPCSQHHAADRGLQP